MLRFVLVLLLLQTSLFSLSINDKIKFNELLSHSEIYIDHNRSETISTVPNRPFEPNSEPLLGFGYSPDFDVWIKFTLTNTTSHTLHKIIEYGNPLTSQVTFFEDNALKKTDGLLHRSNDRMSLNPHFKVTFKPHQTKVFYIKASSKITTLIIKLNVWTPHSFYEKDKKNQMILTLFFGAMFITILYNITIFLATRALSYLYYVLFFATVSFHHLMYKGVATLYLFSPEVMATLINYSSVIVALPTISLALFTQNILTLKQYPKLNTILNYLLILYPIVIIIIRMTEAYQYRSLFFMVILLYLFCIACYTLIKKNEQARFIIVGWVFYVSSGILMYLSSLGTYHVFERYPYLTELSLAIEIVVFSLALGSKINMLNQEQIVSQKRALLLKELNHRFKNSMQTILSFLFFQKNRIEDKNTQEILTNLENRIMATTQLYSLLHTENNMIVVDTQKYFSLIVKNIKESFTQEDIEIAIHSDINMDSEYVVYCGLIVNEAVTNAFKYAFTKTRHGKIEISMYEKADQYHLTIKDNGNGFKDKMINDKSLGLYIIETLATLQLDGTLNIKKENGVQIDISWRKDEK